MVWPRDPVLCKNSRPGPERNIGTTKSGTLWTGDRHQSTIPKDLAAAVGNKGPTFGVARGDVVALAAGALILTTVALVVGVLPAQHAANTDPLKALRYD